MDNNRAIAAHIAQADKLKRGEWISTEPFGYRREYIEINGEPKSLIVTDPECSEIVKTIYKLYITGSHSIRELSKDLSSEFCQPLSRNAVNNILCNKFYCGFMVVNGISYPHNYEKLVDLETFNKAKNILKLKNSKTKKVKEERPLIFFLYRNLLQCKICNCKLSPTFQKQQYKYYGCSLAKIKHRRKYVMEKNVTEQIVQKIRSIKNAEEFIQILMGATLQIQHIILNYLFISIFVDENAILHFIDSPTATINDLKRKLATNEEEKEAAINFETDNSKNIYVLCKKPISINALIEKSNLDVSELQSILFDLQMQDRIEEIEMGVWKSKG